MYRPVTLYLGSRLDSGACIVRRPVLVLRPSRRDHAVARSLMSARADVPSETSPTAATDEPRRSAKWKARRDAIIDTSAPIFARRGYHATGIAELCEVNRLG